MSEAEVTIKKWMKNIFLQKNITNPKIKIMGNSEKGEGFLSTLMFVEVISDDKTVLNVVIKSCTTDDTVYFPLNEAFDIEINFYREVYPKYKELLKNVDVKLGIPEVYDCFVDEQHKVIILEDIKLEGYVPSDKGNPDIDHIKLVLENYAKFHAVGFVFQLLHPEAETITSKFKNLYLAYEKKIGLDFIYYIIKEYYKIFPKDSLEKLENIDKNFRHILIDLEKTCEPSIIIHGDSWINNLLFKYTNEKPVSVTMLDFQYVRRASPIYDLSFFLCGLCGQNQFEPMDELLNFYYDNLSSTLKKLDCDPDKVFSYQMFQDHWKKYSIYGFMMAPCLLKLSLIEMDEVPITEEEVHQFPHKLIRASDVHHQKLKHVAQYFLKSNIL